MRISKKWLFGIVGVLCLVIAGYFMFRQGISTTRLPKKYIAYIGRHTNYKDTIPIAQQEKNKFDLMHEIVLRTYIDQLNAQLSQVQYELRSYDNHRDFHISDSLYKNTIAHDSDVVLVLDNTWGEHLLPSASSIRQNNIPVISMNADRNDGDFGNGTLFIGNDDDAPLDISTFLKRVLGDSSVIFISEVDYPLHGVYLRDFQKEGITVRQQFDLTGKGAISSESEAEALARIKEFYRGNPGAARTPIIINAHREWGYRVLGFLDDIVSKATVLGNITITDFNATRNFGANGNQLIVLSRPNDAVTKRVSNDLDYFRNISPEYFASPSAPFFIKRCQDVMEIVKGMKQRLDTPAISKPMMTTYLNSLRDSAIAGEQDIYRFDSNLVVKDIYFTKYRDSKYYSFPVQLNSERKMIPNLFLGFDILDMYDIDINTNTFKADFFYWVKLDTSYRDAEKYIVFQNILQTESSREMVVEKIEDEVIYRLYKVSGKFHHDFELRSFPLDQQEIAIKVEILEPVDRLKVSFDQSSIDNDSVIFERFKVRAWNKLKYYVTVDNRIASTMRGDPDNQEGKLTVFKSFSFRLLVKRKFAGPFLEIILPLVLIGFVAISLLYVKDISFENLGEVSVGTFLGIITFSIALSNITPSSDYLTKADLLFWMTFMIVLLSFMTIIVINSRYRLDQLDGVSIKPIRYLASVLYPVAILWVLLVDWD